MKRTVVIACILVVAIVMAFFSMTIYLQTYNSTYLVLAIFSSVIALIYLGPLTYYSLAAAIQQRKDLGHNHVVDLSTWEKRSQAVIQAEDILRDKQIGRQNGKPSSKA